MSDTTTWIDPTTDGGYRILRGSAARPVTLGAASSMALAKQVMQALLDAEATHGAETVDAYAEARRVLRWAEPTLTLDDCLF